MYLPKHTFANKYTIRAAACLSLRKLLTNQSQTFCFRVPCFFPRTILSPYFSFFVAFRCIPSACKTNSEDIVEMDSSKFGKLSVGLIVNLCFCAMQGFPRIRPSLIISQAKWYFDASMQSLYNSWLARHCQPENQTKLLAFTSFPCNCFLGSILVVSCFIRDSR